MKDKNRHWTFLVYPESAPTNWFEILQQTGLPFAVSPLHDKDLNPTGEQKKPHYHIVVCFPGPTTYNKVSSDICNQLNATIPQRVLSIVGIYRYFIHKDNPEKYQYDERDIRSSNGFDIGEYTTLTTNQILFYKKELLILCQKKKFTEYSQLVNYLLKNDCNDLLLVVSNFVVFFDRYLSSMRNQKKDFDNQVRNMLK